RTALAEAEVEYAPHTSPSIYVKFPLPGEVPTFAVIWTTTPWTLPANLAIAVNPTFEYVYVDVGGERWLLAKDLVEKVLAACGRTGTIVGAPILGADLEGIVARHPFEDRDSPIFTGDHV